MAAQFHRLYRLPRRDAIIGVREKANPAVGTPFMASAGGMNAAPVGGFGRNLQPLQEPIQPVHGLAEVGQ